MKITMKFISDRAFIPAELSDLSEEEKYFERTQLLNYNLLRIEKVLSLKTISLEWCNLAEIDNLEVFEKLKTLYLQYVSNKFLKH